MAAGEWWSGGCRWRDIFRRLAAAVRGGGAFVGLLWGREGAAALGGGERKKVRGEFISLGKTEQGNGGDIFERMT